MNELLENLYQDIIIDHSNTPRNFHILAHPDICKEGHNMVCGDNITICINKKNEVIVDICFQGNGCAISIASASIMTTLIKGKTVQQYFLLFEMFQLMVTKGEIYNSEKLGELIAFSKLSDFPMRVKCATLAWHTLNAALKQNIE